MSSIIFKKLLIAIFPIFLLTACGEGYEMVPYEGTPYNGERTAGKGVAYVRIKLLPKKGLDSAPPAGVEPAPTVAPADKIFNKAVTK